MKEAVILLSGGLDSATLAYSLKSQGYSLMAVYTDLGMSHSKRELSSVEYIANKLRIPLKIVPYTGMSGVIGAFGNPGYLEGGDVISPEPWPDIKAEFESNASAIFNTISPGFYIARALGIKEVALGVVAEDVAHRPEIEKALALLSDALQLLDTTKKSVGEKLHFSLPLSTMSKADVVSLAKKLDVPIAATYSCMQGRSLHCGQCSNCLKRRSAIREVISTDPTWYEESPNVPMRQSKA